MQVININGDEKMALIQTLLTTGLERIIQSYLQLDEETFRKIRTLHPKVIHISIKDWNIQYYIFPDDHGVSLQSQYEGTPDVSITGTLTAFASIGLSKGPLLKLSDDLEIMGDTVLAQTFSQIALQSRIDWEEILSMLTGDGIAHYMTTIAKKIKKFRQYVEKNLEENVTEYLQEEIQCTPSISEIEDFFSDISTLKNDTDRLIATFRINIS